MACNYLQLQRIDLRMNMYKVVQVYSVTSDRVGPKTAILRPLASRPTPSSYSPVNHNTNTIQTTSICLKIK